MVDLLSRTLDGAGVLRTTEPRAVLGLLAQLRKVSSQQQDRPAAVRGANPDEALSVAKRLNAGRYVIGDVVEAGGRIRMTARLYGAGSAASPVIAAVDGPVDDLFALIDDMTAQLAIGGSDGPGSRLPKTAAKTTSSLDALKAFLQGEQHFRGGRRDDGVRCLYARSGAGSGLRDRLVPAFAIGVLASGVEAAWSLLKRQCETSPTCLGASGDFSKRTGDLPGALCVNRKPHTARSCKPTPTMSMRSLVLPC